MNKKALGRLKFVLAGFGILLVISMIFASFSFVSGYKSQLDNQAQDRAAYLLKSTENDINDKIDEILDEARKISEHTARYTNKSNFCQYLEWITDHTDETNEFNPALVAGRYVKDGEIYTSSASKYLADSTDILAAVDKIDSISFLGVFYDTAKKQNLSCVAIPYAHESGLYDAVIIYYVPSLFETISLEAEEYKEASFLALARSGGQLTQVIKSSNLIDENKFLESLNAKVSSTEEQYAITSNLSVEKSAEATVHIGDASYIFAISKVNASNMYMIGLYESSNMFASEYSFYNTIAGLLIFFAGIMVILLAVMVGRYIYVNYYNKSEHRNITYGCLTQSGFVSEASNIFKQYQGSKFAVVVAQIRFYKYIVSLGDGMDKKMAMSIRSLIQKTIGQREVYGYDSNGKFYLFLNYHDVDDIKKRLDTINQVVKRIKIDNDKRLSLYFGACVTEKDRDVLTTVEHANEALRITESMIGVTNFHMYDNSDAGETLDREFIEMNVERALQKGDFKVFYQPKYDIKRNGVDGAEALVRWYIPEENRFYPPAAFLPVIESNGFIGKVDRYVLEQVCIYLRNSLDNGDRVYPISVNVSRVTIAQEDFVDFYASIKQKYKIRNGLLVVELTESAEFDEYFKLADIIDRLHQNGFICSMDDFGTGYSSYNCLKLLKMDEIKLDRFFLKPGTSPESDKAIIKSVIELGRSLGMKVTTEGVSTVEELNMLRELGCDVIQGYLYAKPMPQADFVSFLTSSMHGRFE